MRADRLLSIVLLLQRHQRLTANTLAGMLGVTERTIYRDIEALSLAGVPVYTRTGPDGGCFLDEGYRHNLNWFTGSELQALLYTGSASPLSDLGMEQAMDNAVLKLLALLPDHRRQQAEQMQQRLYLDPSGWYGTVEAHPTLHQLKEAVWGDYWIEAHYETWEGHQQLHTLAPYSLVYKSGRWYLVALNANSNAVRTYRVARFSQARLLTSRFERDTNFEITSYWSKSSDQFLQRLPEYPVKLRARSSTLIYFQHMFAGRFKVLKNDGEWLMLTVQYMVFEEARTSVLGLGTDVEVLEPQELHHAVVEQAKAIIAKYHEKK